MTALLTTEFTFVHGDSVLARFKLREGEYLIGRGTSCGIAIDLEGVALEHSRLFVRDEVVWIEDAGTEEGTYLGGSRLTSRSRLAPETPVTFGNCAGFLRLEPGAALAELTPPESPAKKGGTRKAGRKIAKKKAESASKSSSRKVARTGVREKEGEPKPAPAAPEPASPDVAYERALWESTEAELRHRLADVEARNAALAADLERRSRAHAEALQKADREFEEIRTELKRARIEKTANDGKAKDGDAGSQALMAKAHQVVTQKLAAGAREVEELRTALKQREGALVEALIRRQTAEVQCLNLARQLKRDEESPALPTPKPRNPVAARTLALRVAFVGLIASAIAVPFLALKLRTEEQRTKSAQVTVDAVKGAAPQFYDEASSLLAERRFREALQQVRYALALNPGAPEYHLLCGHLHEALLQIEPALAAYDRVLALDRANVSAARNRELCRRILLTRQGVGTLESKYALHRVMVDEARWPEALEVAQRYLGSDLALVYHTWCDVLAAHGIRERLTLNDERSFDLDLSGLSRVDLTLLHEMPVVRLNLSRSQVEDLAPLKGLPLRELNLADTQVRDLTPLAEMPLESLNLAHTEVNHIFPLAGLRLKELVLDHTRVSDLSVLEPMPLERLRLASTPVQKIHRLRGLPLRQLDLSSTRVTAIDELMHLPLEELNLAHTGIADLAPLRGAQLVSLILSGTKVTSLEPLRGAPLKRLALAGCDGITDFQPLETCPDLERLIIPKRPQDLKSVQALRWLRFLSWEEPPNPEGDVDETAQHFWEARAAELPPAPIRRAAR